MKRAWILACSLILVSAAGLATPGNSPIKSPVTLASILAPGSLDKTATCTVDCGNGQSVTCTATSGTCGAVNRNCPSQRGSVTCNGITTSCAAACPLCTEGTTREVFTMECCAGNLREYRRDRCTNGNWVDTGSRVCKVRCNDFP